MATIREKGPYQWQAQIRRKGWPYQHATFRTRKDAEAWARSVEGGMDRGLFVDQSLGRETTLRDLIELYLMDVTARRPSEHSRVSETTRLKRFMREERALCAYAAVNLRPEHFEDYRDRRLFPMTPNAFRLAFNRARAKAGLEHFHFHDTRHERISSLFEANWSMIQVMAQTGHRDPKSVKRYANLNGNYLAVELAKLEQRQAG